MCHTEHFARMWKWLKNVVSHPSKYLCLPHRACAQYQRQTAEDDNEYIESSQKNVHRFRRFRGSRAFIQIEIDLDGIWHFSGMSGVIYFGLGINNSKFTRSS